MVLVNKVLAYITRQVAGQMQVLAHQHRDHPDAGVQVPSGTVEPGEDAITALWREVREEAGLTDLTLVGQIDEYAWWNPHKGQWQRRHVFHLEAPPDLPETWSHTVTGAGEDSNLVFVYRWLPLDEAARRLAGEQGRSLARLNQ